MTLGKVSDARLIENIQRELALLQDVEEVASEDISSRIQRIAFFSFNDPEILKHSHIGDNIQLKEKIAQLLTQLKPVEERLNHWWNRMPYSKNHATLEHLEKLHASCQQLNSSLDNTIKRQLTATRQNWNKVAENLRNRQNFVGTLPVEAARLIKKRQRNPY